MARRNLEKVSSLHSNRLSGVNYIMRSFITYMFHTNINVIKSKRTKLAGHVACIGEIRNAYKIFIRKTEGNRQLGGSSRRWEHNIRMDLREIGWKCVDWIHLAQDKERRRPFVNTVMNHQVA